MGYFTRGGKCFFLVKSLSTSTILLFEGDQGARIMEHGLDGADGVVCRTIEEVFEALERSLASFRAVY